MTVTRIQNKLKDAENRPIVNAPVEITLIGPHHKIVLFEHASGGQIAGRSLLRTDDDGYWIAVLYGNETIIPVGTFYKVTHYVPGGPDQTYHFTVPNDGQIHDLSERIIP